MAIAPRPRRLLVLGIAALLEAQFAPSPQTFSTCDFVKRIASTFDYGPLHFCFDTSLDAFCFHTFAFIHLSKIR
jgi:hypothetical protein